MRPAYSQEVEDGRFLAGCMATSRGDRYGCFRLRCPLTAQPLTVIVGDGSDWKDIGLPGIPWEYVSVSAQTRQPCWEEMCWVKSLFFDDEECVVQYHPPKSKYVNIHERVLHMWRPIGLDMPMPPLECV